MPESKPIWEAMAKAGFPDKEVMRVVHYFTRRLNADMQHVVGNKVLYEWEQKAEKFLRGRRP